MCIGREHYVTLRSFGSQNPNIIVHGSKIFFIYCLPKKTEEDLRTCVSSSMVEFCYAMQFAAL
ncbi:hypothetical protein PanWU01x14_023720 [Parasponia andersonii]|uniref:Uncharacterized protein n=1 Tax=Parasponia andersonii TaxID=3476 RepID=A0A2P5DXJ5_PARAD|nr:hypothetical protein PanWU01x14_023720 [Parasponia andersonii]